MFCSFFTPFLQDYDVFNLPMEWKPDMPNFFPDAFDNADNVCPCPEEYTAVSPTSLSVLDYDICHGVCLPVTQSEKNTHPKKHIFHEYIIDYIIDMFCY